MPSASLVQTLSMGLQASREAINPGCFTPLQYLYTDMPLSYSRQHRVIHPSFVESLAASHFFCMHDKQQSGRSHWVESSHPSYILTIACITVP